MAKKVPQPVKSTDYYSRLCFHVGKNDAASKNLSRIKEDYKVLVFKFTFSVILPVKGGSSWLWDWCHHKGFGFYDTFFNDLLGKNGMHMSLRGKGTFHSKLAKSVRQALK